MKQKTGYRDAHRYMYGIEQPCNINMADSILPFRLCP